ncbi:MAG: TPM domain-containing protein [Bacteroidales bacterium]|nr:TPM domain-containing protein [Bacteroidales bacterium]MCF8386813.1 TPM domain-containing protein [Bacteroidales bacterium]MCF8398648.1 TPM domain-containing protein [Bacteroidales bacterium]
MPKSARSFFSRQEKAEIKQAILNAELDTSGEIRVHIENHCDGDVLERAAVIFEKLKMHDTDLRNGVLFYLAVQDKKFAIIGDKGINAAVPENFWDEIKENMKASFKNGKFTEGLVDAINSAGNHLKKHFPYHSDDINELSNEISFGS